MTSGGFFGILRAQEASNRQDMDQVARDCRDDLARRAERGLPAKVAEMLVKPLPETAKPATDDLKPSA